MKFSETDESRFLGPSSGIAMARLVIELAKRNATNRSIQEVVSLATAHDVKATFEQESQKPTSKVYPLLSSIPAPDLPTGDLMEKLLDVYMAKAQYMIPLLHEPTFRQDVQAVYHGATDATLNFQLRMVVAISMQKLDTQFAGLADSYYLAALPFLDKAVRKMDLSTLQCVALIAQYSLLTPTRTASYWVVGLGVKLCHDLGLCDERTIAEFPPGHRFNTLEVDMRRRLFWIITQMEYGLSHSLGRPSAYGISVDHIDVGFFEQCDDRFITPTGLLTGHHPIMKKCISIHFLKMRLLQAEIRRMLYLKRRETPLDDKDPWFAMMNDKIDRWVKNCPKNDEGSGLSEAWFIGRKNIMTMMLYRPSPQIPEPSAGAALKCYQASTHNIDLQKYSVEAKTIDLTWIFTQSVFLSINTILWSISYPEIRYSHPRAEVELHLGNVLQTIRYAIERWPGVQSAIELYQTLIRSCLKAYETDRSYVVQSPSNKASPVSPMYDAGSPTTNAYSPATTAPSLAMSQSPQTFAEQFSPPLPQIDTIASNGLANSSPIFTGQPLNGGYSTSAPSPNKISMNDIPSQNGNAVQSNDAGLVTNASYFGLANFDPNSISNILPSAIPGLQYWDPNVTSGTMQPNYMATTDVTMDDMPWLGSFGDEYSRFNHSFFPSDQHQRVLDQEQQNELMATLEKSQLPDVSRLMSDDTTYYNPHLV